MLIDLPTRDTPRGIEMPPPGGVRVWLFRAEASLAARLHPTLGPDEAEDVERLARERDRHAATVSRGVWRDAAGRLLGVGPDEVIVERTGYGRPYPKGLERTVADLSVTHGGDLVGLAVGRGVRVGVDVEQTTGAQIDDHVSRAVETVTGPAIDLVPDRTERVLFAWCVLEALLKADGRGMHLNPSMVSAEIRTLWGWNSARVAGTAWWVRRFETPSGHIGALACGSPAVDVGFAGPI